MALLTCALCEKHVVFLIQMLYHSKNSAFLKMSVFSVCVHFSLNILPISPSEGYDMKGDTYLRLSSQFHASTVHLCCK